jgi:two-component system response regulator AtoC
MKPLSPLETWLGTVGPGEALEALAELMPKAAIFAVDAQRDVVLWSGGAEALLGFSRDEVLGRHCLVGIRCPRCLGGCGIAQHGAVADVPLRVHRKDGTEIAVRKWGRAFQGPDGSFLGGVEILLPASEGAPAPEAPRTLVPDSAQDTESLHGILSRDPGMIRALRTIRNVAETEATVLVRGESGTGKELVARALHGLSLRREGPFVAVNCAAFTPSLLESELFGHVRGAFTGATSDRAGIFAQAHGGTLFLDEVGELPLELQGKLLRVLQERAVTPVGGRRSIPVDVRVVSATHRALREEMRAGRFREDLMYRLRVVPVFLPALRERPADIPLLLDSFVQAANRSGPRHVRSVAPEVLKVLLDHAWPGNVRELQNVVAYAFAVGRDPVLGLEDLPPELRDPGAERVRMVRDERAALVDALRRSQGDLAQAADLLGISRTTLWRWRKRYGV